MSVFQVRLLSSDSISIGACACLHNHPTYRIVKVDSMRELLPEDRDSLAVLSLPTANNAPDKLGVTTPLLLLVDEQEQEVPPVITSRPLCAILGTRPGKLVLQKTLQSLARHASSHTEIETLSKRIRSAQKELDKFNRIGMALGSERDTERLFDLILQYARQITDADGEASISFERRPMGMGRQRKFSTSPIRKAKRSRSHRKKWKWRSPNNQSPAMWLCMAILSICRMYTISLQTVYSDTILHLTGK